jgi:arylsulfatase A-like enzyme
MMGRWRFLGAIVPCLLIVGGCDGNPAEPTGRSGDVVGERDAANGRPPNIVFIFADDLGIGDTGVYGSEVIETPHIDALAADGVRFTQGYVSHPVCSPSRAGLMTGRYQQRHGWEFNPAGRDEDSGMSVGERTMADVLKAAGYATGMVGKWHLGYQGGHHPQARGFDDYFGVLAGGSLFIDPDVPGVESAVLRATARTPRTAVFRGRKPVEVDDYLTDVFTNEALAFIDAHQSEPFFLYLSHTTPHTPLQATAKYLDRYRHVEDKATRIYAAMVSSLDDSVGLIVSKLEEIGQLDNTLIIFSSDNGCAGYINGACSNAPHAGFKRYHQEGGIRVPLIMRWPERLDQGVLYEHPVISLDLLATFSSAAGGSETTEDSVDLLPYLTGAVSGAPHEYLYWRSGPSLAIRGDRWKLIKYNRSLLTADDLRADGRLEPPEGGWPSDSPDGQLTLLFDLTVDPGETENLALEHPEVVLELERRHESWARDLTEPLLPAIRSTLAEMHGETVQLIF